MRIALLGLAAFGLAACGGPETPKPADAPAAETPAGPATAETPALPAGLTGPAAGKWKMTLASSTGMAMPAQEFCYEKQISLEEAQAMQQSAGVTCSEQSFTAAPGGGFNGHSVCTMESMTMTTDMKVTGDFNSKYTMESTTSISPAPAGMPNPTTTTITMERLGDCTP